MAVVCSALYAVVAPAFAGVIAPVKMTVPEVRPAPAASWNSGSTSRLHIPFERLDLRGTLPLLPTPAPGLTGGRLNFAPPQTGRGAASSVAADLHAKPATIGRPARRDLKVPARPAPGTRALSIADVERLGETDPVDWPASSPRAGTELGSLSPEAAADDGRRRFDLSARVAGGALTREIQGSTSRIADAPAPASSRPSLAEGGGGVSRRGAVSMAERVLEAAPALAVPAPDDGISVPGVDGGPRLESEPSEMRDAVAAVPMSMPQAAALAGAAPGASRPFMLGLTREGLSVRVRSALDAVLGPASSKANFEPVLQEDRPLRVIADGGPTAWLERGALFEAVSVADAHAAWGGAVVSAAHAGVVASPFEPFSAPADFRLWWMWAAALPLLLAVLRSGF